METRKSTCSNCIFGLKLKKSWEVAGGLNMCFDSEGREIAKPFIAVQCRRFPAYAYKMSEEFCGEWFEA